MIKKNPIAITKLVFVLIYICLSLIFNFRKIKKAKRIFVNSWGFGHSITDTSAYLNHYQGEGGVILLGTSFGQIPGTERNNFFYLLQRHKLIITINLPSAFVTKDNWVVAHPLSIVILKILSFLLGNRKLIIEGSNEHINMNILPKIISENLGIPLIEGKKILAELLLNYKVAENHYQSTHTIQFFFKQPKLNVDTLRPKLNSSLADFYRKNLENRKFVCLTIRRGNAPYHSNANYYQEMIKLLDSNGFSVYLLGDKQYFTGITEQEKFLYSKIVINCNISKQDSKLLDLFAIYACSFVLGDQGGVWSLVHAFNKPGLMINSSCIAHLQYNVESLPRKWIYEHNKTEVCDVNFLFKELYFRYKPFYNSHGKLRVIQVENDLDLILRVANRYINKFEYLFERKMQKRLTNHFTSNNQLKLANGSCYSDEYIDKLVFE